ncbi:MAG: O-antigen ligase family protein [Candidatus Berkelbacteria bacterium]
MSRYLTLLAIFLLPAYIFRFSILGIPTNVFEVVVGISLLIFIIEKLICHAELVSASKNEIPKQVRDDSAKNDNDKKKIAFGFWPTYLLLFFALISVAFSPDKAVALGIAKGWFFIPAVLYFLIINLFDKKTTRLLVIPLFISLMLVSVWAILQKLGVITTLFYQVGDSGFLDYFARFRAFGPFESPNYLAMFIVPVGFLTLPIFSFFKKGIDKVLIAVFYLLPLCALYTSRSLGGLIAFGFALICFLAFGLAKAYRAHLVNSGSKITGWIVGLILVAVAFAVIFSSISNETYSTHIRIDIYKYSLQLIESYPIFGIGLGNFQSAVKSISTSNSGFVTYGLSYAIHPQNLFLALWLNIGFLGLISFLYIVGSFFWNLGRRGGDILIMAAVFAAMASIVVHGLVDTTYFKNDLSAIFWLILSIGFLIKKPNENSN